MKAHSKILRILLIVPALSLLTACTDTMFEDGDSAPALVPVGEEGTLFLAPGISLPEGEGNYDIAYSEATSTSRQSVRKRATYYDGEKKGIYFQWQTDDKVGIFPIKDNNEQTPESASQQLFNCTSMNSESTEGNSSAHFRPENENFAWTEGYSYRAYYPYNPSANDATQVPLSYTGQKQVGKVDMVKYFDNTAESLNTYYESERTASAHLSDYSYLISGESKLTEGKMQFKMNHLGGIVRFYLSLPITNYSIDVTEVRLVASKPVFTESATINMITGETTSCTHSNCITLTTEGISLSGSTARDFYLMAYMMAYPVALTNNEILGTNGNLSIYVKGKKTNTDEEFYYRSGSITKKDIIAATLTQFSVKPSVNAAEDPVALQPISVQEWQEGLALDNGDGTGTGNW